MSPKKYLLRLAKARAKRKGIEFSISEQDIEIPEECPVLKIPLVFNVGKAKGRGKGRSMPNSPSLDRLDASKGYVKGNVVVISHKANAMKQNATAIDLINFSLWTLEHLNKMNEVEEIK